VKQFISHVAEDKMSIRDTLLALVGEPSSAAIDAIAKCVGMARAIGARISAVAMETDLHVRPRVMTSKTDLAKGIKSVTDAQGLLTAFHAAARRSAVRYDQRIERIEVDDVPARLARFARVKDLTFFPVKVHNVQSGKIIEQLLFESGRPILLCPEEFAGRLVVGAEQAAIAWDHTAPAARAVGDALPYLKAATTVRVFTVTDEATAQQLESGAALLNHLAEHGIKAVFETVKFNGSSVGKIFAAYTKSHAIDLLVMGAYHHSRFSESLWGGATNTVIGRPPCWVLMAR
jgi:nucleotide-binding universal stress UspA family protein